MFKVKIYLFAAATVSFTVACRPHSLNIDNSDVSASTGVSSPMPVQELLPIEYLNWCKSKNNGLVKNKELGDLTFSLQYKPHEYVVCLEQKKEFIEEAVLNKELEELD